MKRAKLQETGCKHSGINMISFFTKEAEKVLMEFSQKLDNYICSSKSMSEQMYRDTYETTERDMAFVQHQPLGGDFDIYRSRMADSIQPNEDITSPATFSYVPKEKCSPIFPKLQRCNFTGQSIFYASLSLKKNFIEIDKDCCAGKSVYISKWHVNDDANANVFRAIPPEGIDLQDDYRGLLKIDKERNYPSCMETYLCKIGEVFMNNEEGISKYLPSALISNFIYNFNYFGEPLFQGQSYCFHGVIYPSVKDKTRCSLNVAFTPEFIDSYANLKWVIKGTINEDLVSVRMQEIGFCHDNRIFWYKLFVPRESITLNGVYSLDIYEKTYDTRKGKLFDKNHMEVNNIHAAFFSNIDQLMEQLLIKFPEPPSDINEIVDESLFNKKIDEFFIVKATEGWAFETENNTIDIVGVVYTFEYSITLKEI